MIDGITTSWLPLDVYKLADKQGVDTYRDSVCVNANGLKFDYFDGVDTNTGEIRKVCTLRGRLHKYANGGLHNADSFRLSDLCRVNKFICLIHSYSFQNSLRIIRKSYIYSKFNPA